MTQGEMLLRATVDAVIEAIEKSTSFESADEQIEFVLHRISSIVGITDDTVKFSHEHECRLVIENMLKTMDILG